MHSLRNKSSFSRDKDWVYRQESDICMLHLFESFMGATPQLILQLYIIATLYHAPFWTSEYYLLFVDSFFKYYSILYFMYIMLHMHNEKHMYLLFLHLLYIFYSFSSFILHCLNVCLLNLKRI